MRTPVLILDDGRYLTYQGDVLPAVPVDDEQLAARQAIDPEYTRYDWYREHATGDALTLGEVFETTLQTGRLSFSTQWFTVARKKGHELAELSILPEGMAQFDPRKQPPAGLSRDATEKPAAGPPPRPVAPPQRP
ncbi:hypothetical protein [Rhodococcus sp. B10]|uniref:hypothetical protein n=1 Tax=Rhodococcus sp. B10 TaxID=2695876 RepID=UPI0014313E43|nr:hypothetical protein [Rhodococcus sp. B10]NIL74408.1 hypothetical protein [Rhodococcus sp. B10]